MMTKITRCLVAFLSFVALSILFGSQVNLLHIDSPLTWSLTVTCWCLVQSCTTWAVGSWFYPMIYRSGTSKLHPQNRVRNPRRIPGSQAGTFQAQRSTADHRLGAFHSFDARLGELQFGCFGAWEKVSEMIKKPENYRDLLENYPFLIGDSVHNNKVLVFLVSR